MSRSTAIIQYVAHLHFAHSTVANTINFRISVVSIRAIIERASSSNANDTASISGPWSAAWMPYGASLQVHLLAISERISTLCAASTSWMEMVIVSSLENSTFNC